MKHLYFFTRAGEPKEQGLHIVVHDLTDRIRKEITL